MNESLAFHEYPMNLEKDLEKDVNRITMLFHLHHFRKFAAIFERERTNSLLSVVSTTNFFNDQRLMVDAHLFLLFWWLIGNIL